jgi:thioredoxin reductase (NADPH)
MDLEAIYDIIVIGGGPAGLTSAIYAARARLNTLVIEKAIVGGELMNRDLIENYPGHPDGIYGPELGSKLTKQVTKLGVEIKFAEVMGLGIDDRYRNVTTSEGNYWGKAVIIAGGARYKKLGVRGEEEFHNRGVINCATCDGPAYAERIVAVAGGGDSGISEALFLSKMASKVIVVEALPALTATPILQERASMNPRIEVKCGVKIERIEGDGEVKAIRIVDLRTQESSVVKVDAVLVHVGLEPNTEYLKNTVTLDAEGRIIVNRWMETVIPQVFAAGDIRSDSPGQIVTAVGDGATAAISAQRALEKSG